MTEAAGTLPARPLHRAGVRTFARAWTKAIMGTSYVPLNEAEIEALLADLAERLAQALQEEPFRPQTGQQVGSDLVAAHFASAEALGRTVEVVHLRLLRDLGLSTEDSGDRMARLLGTIATGYARALRDRTLDGQEAVRRAALTARQHAEAALRDSEARFRHQATHDPLTGLPNRVLFTERLRSLFAHATAGDRLGLCFVDLDRFKMINDRLGHHVGDKLLVAVAERLEKRLPDHLVARLGGDEFVILVPASEGVDHLRRVGDAALAAICEPSVVEGQELTVSASIGIVERPVAGTDPSEVMRAADMSLHWAKDEGKGRWALFDQERNERELVRYALSADMPGALDRGEFRLEYQPLACLAGGGLIGAEALVRWEHPAHGLLPPNRFIGLAEETGLIVRLGGWILDQACRHALQWTGDGRGGAPFVSVNLAVRQVCDPGLVAEVTAVLERTGLPAGRLQLEITESALMSDRSAAVQALQTLVDRGVRIAIDDFGTGYSNLSYLRTLPVHTLKIDGSFVAGVGAPPDGGRRSTEERILASLVSLAHTLGLTVTAEGVETPDQERCLREIGCDTAQGWHVGRPGSPATIAALLRSAA